MRPLGPCGILSRPPLTGDTREPLDPSIGTNAETPEIDAFLAELEAVCAKHGLSLGVEDPDVAFVVERHNASSAEAMQSAYDCTNFG